MIYSLFLGVIFAQTQWIGVHSSNGGEGVGELGDKHFCNSDNICNLGQGDCDNDDECIGDLYCGDNNCKDFNPSAERTFDCCTNKTREMCASNEFTCDNGACTDATYQCDGDYDCDDDSDEKNCPEMCASNEFTCGDGKCIRANYRCDGVDDCDDESDEKNCPGCASTEFTCDDGECIWANYRCDGEGDCDDMSDEKNCPGQKSTTTTEAVEPTTKPEPTTTEPMETTTNFENSEKSSTILGPVNGCKPCKMINSGNEELHGIYYLDLNSNLRANDECKDSCIYMRDGEPFCFVQGGPKIEPCDVTPPS